MLDYYIAANRQDKIEETYQFILDLPSIFFNKNKIAPGLANALAAVLNYYLVKRQWTRVDDLHQDFEGLQFKFYHLIAPRPKFLDGTNETVVFQWAVSKTLTYMIIHYMATDEKILAHKTFQDLQSITANYSEQDLIGQNRERLSRYMSDTRNWGIHQEETLQNWALVNRKCAQLFNELRINAEILSTDDEFYSEETHLKTIKEKRFFISAESPEETFLITKVLVKQSLLRYQLMHSSRVEKAAQTSQDLASRINEIRKEYSDTHNGEDPSLNKLAKILSERQVVSPGGKTTWHAKSVQRILDSKPNSLPNK